MSEIDWNELTAELEHELCRAAKKVAERFRLLDDASIEFRVLDSASGPSVAAGRYEVFVTGSLDLPSRSDPNVTTFPTGEQVAEWLRQGIREAKLPPVKRWTEPISEGNLLAQDSNGCLHLARAGEMPIGVALRSSDEREGCDLSRPSDLVRRLQVRDLTKAITGMLLYNSEGREVAVVEQVNQRSQMLVLRYRTHGEIGSVLREIPFSHVKDGCQDLWLTEENTRLVDRTSAAGDPRSQDDGLRPLSDDIWQRVGSGRHPVLYDTSGVQVAQVVHRNSYPHMPNRRYLVLERIGDRWNLGIRGAMPHQCSVCEVPLNELLEAGLFVRRRDDEQPTPRGGLARLAVPALKWYQWLPAANIEAQRRWVEDRVDVGYRASVAFGAGVVDPPWYVGDDGPPTKLRKQLDELRPGFKQELLDELEQNPSVVAKPDLKVDLKCNEEKFSDYLKHFAGDVQQHLDAVANRAFFSVPRSVCDEEVVAARESSVSDPYRCVCSHGGLNGCPGYLGRGRCVSLPEDEDA